MLFAGVDSRNKGPLLQLEGAAGVWPPPRSGSTELEDPLLMTVTPSLQFSETDSFCVSDSSDVRAAVRTVWNWCMCVCVCRMGGGC